MLTFKHIGCIRARHCLLFNIFLIVVYQFMVCMLTDVTEKTNNNNDNTIVTKDFSTPSPTVDGGIDNLLPKHILAELPILTNMICDEAYNIDSIKSKEEVDKSRSCLFTDYSLCYNFKKTEWIYYTNIDAFVYDINGKLNKLQLPITLNNTIRLRFAADTPKTFEKVTNKNKFDFTIDYKKGNSYNNSFFSDVMTIFGEPTCHGDNIAHVLWEYWFKIYMLIDNFVYNGIIYDNTSFDLILKKLPEPSADNNIYALLLSKYRNAYEPILFNDVIFGLDELHEKYLTFDQICFKNIVIGTNEYAAMFYPNNAIHTNNQLVKYLRKKILNYYGLNDLHKPKKINILFIKKSVSFNGRKDFIFNLLNNEIVNATKRRYSLHKEIDVLTLDPKNEDIEKQINVLYKSLIIVCPIGGISYTNFLQPLNGVQIYLIKWGIHPEYMPADFNETLIPENDHEYHNMQVLQTILKYVDLSDKYKYNYTKEDMKNWDTLKRIKDNLTWNIKEEILFNVIDKAIWLIRERFDIAENIDNTIVV